MNPRTLLLAIFVMLTVVFASLTFGEYSQVNNLNSQLQSQSRSTVMRTLISTTTVVTTDTCPSIMKCASFTYSPNPQVQIVSVEANKTYASTHIVFWVTVENTGISPIQLDNYALNFSVPANSSVLRQVDCPCFPGGTDITGGYSLNPGESYTLDAGWPNTKSFYYQVVQPGTVDVNLNFTWTEGNGAPIPPNTTTISAQFAFP